MNKLVFLEGSQSPWERLFRAMARAEDRLSRLDERVAASGLASGWRQRADIRAALASTWQGGDLVHAEDLVLHALAADLRAPDRAVLRAHAYLRGRQKMWLGGEELLSWRGVVWVTARTRSAPPPGPRPTLTLKLAATDGSLADLEQFFQRLARHASLDARNSTEECLEVLDLTASAPPLLAAVALLEAWRLADPLPEENGIGFLLAAQVLRTRHRFTAGLFPLETALRRSPMPPRIGWASLPDRLRFWCETVERSADLELDELSRLKTQKVLIERRARSARRSSKAPALAALAVQHSVLTTEFVARELGVTAQGAGALLKRFEGVLQEITGRAAYRVWRL